MTATRRTTSTTSSTFASRLRAAVEQDQGSVPAHRRARDWHGSTQRDVANPRRTRGLTADATDHGTGTTEEFAARLRRAVG
jgi:hypothetical protein